MGIRSQAATRHMRGVSGCRCSFIANSPLPTQITTSVAAVAAGAQRCRVARPAAHTNSAMPLPTIHEVGEPSRRGMRSLKTDGRIRWTNPEVAKEPITIRVPLGRGGVEVRSCSIALMTASLVHKSPLVRQGFFVHTKLY